MKNNNIEDYNWVAGSTSYNDYGSLDEGFLVLNKDFTFCENPFDLYKSLDLDYTIGGGEVIKTELRQYPKEYIIMSYSYESTISEEPDGYQVFNLLSPIDLTSNQIDLIKDYIVENSMYTKDIISINTHDLYLKTYEVINSINNHDDLEYFSIDKEEYNKKQQMLKQAYDYIDKQLSSINSKIELMNNSDKNIDCEANYGLSELNMQLSWVLRHVELIDQNSLEEIETFDMFFDDTEIYRLLNIYQVKVNWDSYYSYNKYMNKVWHKNI